MNPEENVNGSATETIMQADTVEKQMTNEAEAAKAAIPEPEVDHSIMADPEENIPVAKPVTEDYGFGIPPEPTHNYNEGLDPTVLVDMNTGDDKSEKKQKTKKNSRLPIFIAAGVLGVAIIGLGVWGIVSLVSSADIKKGSEEAVAFFIQDRKKPDHYALFNSNGDQLSAFDYTEVNDMIENSAVVKKDSAYGVITNTGSMLVPLEKYSDIERVGALFVAGPDGEKIALNTKGEELGKADTYQSRFGQAIIEIDGVYRFYNTKGEEKISGSALTTSLAAMTVENDAGCIAIDAKHYCFDTSTGEEIATFEYKNPVEVSRSYKKHQVVALRGKQYRGDGAVLLNGKLFDIEGASDYYVAYIGDEENGIKLPIITVTDKTGKQYYDMYGKKLEYEPKAVPDGVGYRYDIDAKHWIFAEKVIPDPNKSYDFTLTYHIHEGDKEVVIEGIESYSPKLIDDGKTIVVYGGDSNGIMFIGLDGKVKKQIKNKEIRGISNITSKDSNDNYVIRYGDYYLMNSKDKIIGTYQGIRQIGDRYIVNLNKLTGVVSKTGEVLLDPSRYVDVFNAGNTYIAARGSNEFDILDSEFKPIIKDASAATDKGGYIEVNVSDRTKYYTYEGKEFYPPAE